MFVPSPFVEKSSSNSTTHSTTGHILDSVGHIIDPSPSSKSSLHTRQSLHNAMFEDFLNQIKNLTFENTRLRTENVQLQLQLNQRSQDLVTALEIADQKEDVLNQRILKENKIMKKELEKRSSEWKVHVESCQPKTPVQQVPRNSSDMLGQSPVTSATPSLFSPSVHETLSPSSSSSAGLSPITVPPSNDNLILTPTSSSSTPQNNNYFCQSLEKRIKQERLVDVDVETSRLEKSSFLTNSLSQNDSTILWAPILTTCFVVVQVKAINRSGRMIHFVAQVTDKTQLEGKPVFRINYFKRSSLDNFNFKLNENETGYLIDEDDVVAWLPSPFPVGRRGGVQFNFNFGNYSINY